MALGVSYLQFQDGLYSNRKRREPRLFPHEIRDEGQSNRYSVNLSTSVLADRGIFPVEFLVGRAQFHRLAIRAPAQQAIRLINRSALRVS